MYKDYIDERIDVLTDYAFGKPGSSCKYNTANPKPSVLLKSMHKEK